MTKMNYDKIDKKSERINWVSSKSGLRWVAVDKETGEIVNDCNGYGFRTREKCMNWIRYMQKQVSIGPDKKYIISDPDVATCIRVLKAKGYQIIPPID